MIRNAKLSDISKIADLHDLAFRGFFLTSLGKQSLRILYKYFLQSDNSIFIVDELDGEICGFVVGEPAHYSKSVSTQAIFFLKFGISVGIQLFRHPFGITKGVLDRLRFNKHSFDLPISTILLRSVCVHPTFRGQGSADRLLIQFEFEARRRGWSVIALTTDAERNDRAIGYYKKNGYCVDMEFMQTSSRRMLLMKKYYGNSYQSTRGL